MNYFLFPLLVLLILIVNIFLIKKNYLPSSSGDNHQKLTLNNSIPLSGGIYLILIFFVHFYNQIGLLFFFILAMFLIGLLSDIKIINSAKLRIILQFIVIFSLIISFDLKILSTRIAPFDQLLETNFINYLFVSFCILIIVNGSNFIDGLNTLVIGYYSIITIIIYKVNLLSVIPIDSSLILSWISLLLFIYVLNLLNKLFLGDSGAYFLGFSYAILLIMIHNQDLSVSPFFIILLLWYPGFEILFSIIRKINSKASPLSPDIKHLHQIIFISLNRTFFKKKIYANIISANIINLYNIIIFFIAINDISKTSLQIMLIMINIFIYIITYFILIKNHKLSGNS
jgi:UDP-N-acetylmuramyl pentapeptide phosphotransferase/UDP-N-acetylglucosamine-1-phosphate transferase